MANIRPAKSIVFAFLLGLMSVALISCGPATSQQSGQPIAPQAQPTPDNDDMGSIFPGLEGIPKDQLFDHFRGGQFNLTDRNGAPFTLKMTPGTVNSISSTSIEITPNGETTAQTFNITANTVVRGTPDRGSVQAIAQGDKVVVITRDTSSDAVLISKHGQMFHRRMMESMMLD